MKNLFIPYELAVIAKEKGFNEPCFGFYTEEYKELIFSQPKIHLSNSLPTKPLNAPMYQQIVDWFREKHNIEVSVKSWKNEGDGKVIYVYSNKILGLPSTFRFDFKSELYYETLNKAIEEAFNLI